MNEQETRLLAVLKARCFKRGEFTLASGAKSDHYVDCRLATMSGECLDCIGWALWARLEPCDAVGGMAVGAVPLVTMAVNRAAEVRVMLEGFWVRSEPKNHGTGRIVEGALAPGMRAVILEDVTTTGASAARAVEATREHGCEVVQVLSLVDRLQGGAELFAAMGVPFQSVFTIRDFGVEPR